MTASATSPRAVVAMSGGVDSSVAAALLLEEGCRVEGATLRLWDSARQDRDRVCSDARDAAAVASHLGIPHRVIDERADFERRVVVPFVAAYASGRTPSPCVACNSDFKLGRLLEWAIARGADVVATGHYARVVHRDGRMRLVRGSDPSRDQSYFLFRLTQAQLERTRFPLGILSKREVRERARSFGLPVAEKADSQDLCFGTPLSFLAARGAGGVRGDIVDGSGRVLGRHGGIEGFTVGQRRGLGVGAGVPLYVERLEAESARVVVSTRRPRANALLARDWSWIGEAIDARTSLTLQLRYRHAGAAGFVIPLGPRGRCRVVFDEPVSAIAPGQAVVGYLGEEVVGGGWIDGVDA